MALLLQHCGKVVGLLLWVQVPWAVVLQLLLLWVPLVVALAWVLGLALGLVGLVVGALSAGQAVLGSVDSGWWVLASFPLASLRLAISPTFLAPTSSIPPATTEPQPIGHQISATRLTRPWLAQCGGVKNIVMWVPV